MALPRNNVPTFELTQPSTGKKIKYRPWLVGEQKNLLMALEGGETDILIAVREAVDACTFGKLDMETLPNFDAEYIFLQIRTKSAGQTVDMILTCQHCGQKSERSLDLTEVEVQRTEGHTNKIMLGADLGVEMRYPTTEQLNYLNKNYNVDTVYKTICECIKSVFTAEEVSYTKDEPLEEVKAFIESLTAEQFDQIESFFATMPVLKHTFTNECPHCQKVSGYTLEGIESFFA